MEQWHCEKCGSTKKATYTNLCKSCYCKTYYQDNKERLNTYTSEWSKYHPEKTRVYSKTYYNTHKREKCDKTNEYNKAHPEQTRIASKKFYRKNTEKEIRRVRKYQINNPEKVKVINHRRRVRILGNGGSHTVEEWLAIRDKTKGVCPCCKIYVGVDKLTLDHIQAVANNGSDNIDNIQPLCKKCNTKKGTKTIDYRENIQRCNNGN